MGRQWRPTFFCRKSWKVVYLHRVLIASNLPTQLDMSIVEEFNLYRSRMNEKILGQNNLVLKRFFNLDTNAYQDGALDKKTKELLGLVASMVLRCDDCVRYHLGTCFELGVTKAEVFEVFAIANLVGGSICIPHTRRAVEFWEALEQTHLDGSEGPASA